MCGIAGSIQLDGGAVDVRRAAAMARAIAHRGPDGEGLVALDSNGRWSLHHDLDDLTGAVEQPRVCLTHRRLSIIDLSERGAQPMHGGSGKFWIVFNGELYNYVELRETLNARGHRFHSDSDTEVILRSYLEWGEASVERFNGMFAFVIWDQPNQRAFCARDHLGIKPFYYAHEGARVVFGSEQKAVLAGLANKPSPNTRAMADFLAFSYVVSTDTMFTGIKKLPPGSAMTIDRRGVSVKQFWNPSFDPAESRSSEVWAEELRALLDDSLRMQIRSDVPIGAHLSGGIDSSAVTCLAAKRVPRLTTFTAKFAEGGFFDETSYARLVAEHVDADYREITPQADDIVDLLPKIIYHLDEPVEAASVFGKYHVAEIVSESVKVVLGGQGGDELFGGYDWYVKSAATALMFGAKDVTDASKLSLVLGAMGGGQAKRMLKSLWINRGDTRLARVFYRNWARLDDQRIGALFRPDVYDSSTMSEQRFLDAFDALSVRRESDAMFKFDMRYYLESLLTSEDRLSMAFSVESRVPLLDYRVAELASRLGFEQKATPELSKRVLREALRGIVPESILSRSDKRGFPTPIGRWLSDPQLNLMERFVFNDNSFAAKYFDLDALRRQYAKRSHFSTDWSERNWRILNLCVWGNVFGLE